MISLHSVHILVLTSPNFFPKYWNGQKNEIANVSADDRWNGYAAQMDVMRWRVQIVVLMVTDTVCCAVIGTKPIFHATIWDNKNLKVRRSNAQRSKYPKRNNFKVGNNGVRHCTRDFPSFYTSSSPRNGLLSPKSSSTASSRPTWIPAPPLPGS